MSPSNTAASAQVTSDTAADLIAFAGTDAGESFDYEQLGSKPDQGAAEILEAKYAVCKSISEDYQTSLAVQTRESAHVPRHTAMAKYQKTHNYGWRVNTEGIARYKYL